MVGAVDVADPEEARRGAAARSHLPARIRYNKRFSIAGSLS